MPEDLMHVHYSRVHCMIQDSFYSLQALLMELEQIQQRFWTWQRKAQPGKKVISLLLLYYLFITFIKYGLMSESDFYLALITIILFLTKGHIWLPSVKVWFRIFEIIALKRSTYKHYLYYSKDYVFWISVNLIVVDYYMLYFLLLSNDALCEIPQG